MGHFNACLRMAKILAKDYDVVFVGFSSFKKYVEGQGFLYYPLKTVPFGLGFEKWVNEQEKRKPNYLCTILDRWTDRLYHKREVELTQLMNDLSPEYLFVDSYQSTDFIVLYPYLKKHFIKVALIQTMLPTAANKDCPPLNSDAPHADGAAIEQAHRNFDFSLFRKRLKQQLMFFGMSDNAIIKRRLHRNKIPKYYLSSQKTWRGISFKNIDELVLAPKEFDFEHNSTAHSHYIGFMPDLRRLEISDVTYFKIDQSIRNKLKETNGTLLYCSFGSVEQDEVKVIYNFLLKLVLAVRDQNCILIISAHAIYSQASFKDLPENVFVLKAAPQLQLLERADVFIHHGGLNSIKESIYTGVPMLVYPFDLNTDRIGNASRVVHYELGLRGDLQKDTVDDITQKLTELINNDLYRNNILALREKDVQYDGEFLERFKDLKVIS